MERRRQMQRTLLPPSLLLLLAVLLPCSAADEKRGMASLVDLMDWARLPRAASSAGALATLLHPFRVEARVPFVALGGCVSFSPTYCFRTRSVAVHAAFGEQDTFCLHPEDVIVAMVEARAREKPGLKPQKLLVQTPKTGGQSFGLTATFSGVALSGHRPAPPNCLDGTRLCTLATLLRKPSQRIVSSFYYDTVKFARPRNKPAADLPCVTGEEAVRLQCLRDYLAAAANQRLRGCQTAPWPCL